VNDVVCLIRQTDDSVCYRIRRSSRSINADSRLAMNMSEVLWRGMTHARHADAGTAGNVANTAGGHGPMTEAVGSKMSLTSTCSAENRAQARARFHSNLARPFE
jgi:hypothetical protein